MWGGDLQGRSVEPRIGHDLRSELVSRLMVAATHTNVWDVQTGNPLCNAPEKNWPRRILHPLALPEVMMNRGRGALIKAATPNGQNTMGGCQRILNTVIPWDMCRLLDTCVHCSCCL